MVVVVGVVSAALTTLSWVPQLRRTLRRGTATDFAWTYLLMLGAGDAAWCAYGALRRDLVIVVANLFVLVGIVTVSVVKLRSRRLTFDRLELTVPAGGDMLAALESLVTIGPRLAQDLRAVGITDVPMLRAVGIDEANRRLVDAGLQTGTYSRQAIAGAIAGDWSVQVDPAHRIGQRRSRQRAHH